MPDGRSPVTYRNPVYDRYFADPFVLRVGEQYYAYGTRDPADKGTFDVLRSSDLVSWERVGRALDPLGSPDAEDYWAPEVAHADGRFYMYYSAGRGDAGHYIRVAVASDPVGPFVDQGVAVTPQGAFGIDAHPFQDDDGTWYLFYARDLLDGDRPGTTIAVDRLTTMTSLGGEPRTVVRPTADWQLYLAQRQIYGQVFDWHTVEGPFVRKHAGRYYCLYSGGNWQQANYGVSYVVADSPLGPWHAPDAAGPTILQGVPDAVIGPGHNSVVTGPDGEDWLVYHAWDPQLTARRMCIDRLVWGPDGPQRSGPSQGPQHAPLRAPR